MIIPDVIQNLPTKLPLRTINGYDKMVDISFDLWRLSFIPTLTILENESGLENKYGGRIPYFQQGDKWPTECMLNIKNKIQKQKQKPLAFVCQFIDPFDAENFIQVFALDFLDDELNYNTSSTKKSAYIKKRKLYDMRDQIFIDPPNELMSKNGITSHDTPMLINNWTLKYELDFLCLCIDENYYDENISEYIPSNEFKLFGLGNSCQNVNLYRHYIQNIANGKYGDCGTLHLNKKGYMFGDMA